MRDLREKAGVSLPTIQAIEAGGDFRASTADKIMDAFNTEGVEILNGDAPGARMRARGRCKQAVKGLPARDGLGTRLFTFR